MFYQTATERETNNAAYVMKFFTEFAAKMISNSCLYGLQ